MFWSDTAINCAALDASAYSGRLLRCAQESISVEPSVPFVLRYSVERDIAISLDASRSRPARRVATHSNGADAALHDYCVVIKMPLMLINTLPCAVMYRVLDRRQSNSHYNTVGSSRPATIVAAGVVESGKDCGIALAAGARGSFNIRFKVILIFSILLIFYFAFFFFSIYLKVTNV